MAAHRLVLVLAVGMALGQARLDGLDEVVRLGESGPDITALPEDLGEGDAAGVESWMQGSFGAGNSSSDGAVGGNTSNSTNKTVMKKVPKASFGLPPAIFGGSRGDFLANPAASAGVTLNTGNRSSGSPLAKSKHRNFNGLFDLKPLFMGLQADPVRSAAIVGNKCINSLAELHIDTGLCRLGSHNRTTNVCSDYSLPPMSVAMRALYLNAKTNFCKMNPAGCDTSLCYTYGGTIDPKTGVETSEHQEMKNQAIWVNLRRNVLQPYCNKNCGKKTNQMDDQVITQMINFNVTMEKVVFCEKIGSTSKHAKDRKKGAKKVVKTGRRLLVLNGTNSSGSLFTKPAGTTEKPTNPPPPPTPLEAQKKVSCFASRKCQVVNLEHGSCYNATSGKIPAEEITCPTGTAYRTDVAAKTNELVSTLCGNL